MQAHDEIATHIKPVTIKHIAVAIEHSPGDAKIISGALTLAGSHKADLTLIHVVDTPGVTVYGPDSGSLHSDTDEAYLEHLAEEVEERGFSVETVLRFGRPSDQIARTVHGGKFDLLVLGSHGHHGLSDLVYGETVDKVRHAIDIPVFVVRTHAQERAQEAQ